MTRSYDCDPGLIGYILSLNDPENSEHFYVIGLECAV